MSSCKLTYTNTGYLKSVQLILLNESLFINYLGVDFTSSGNLVKGIKSKLKK